MASHPFEPVDPDIDLSSGQGAELRIHHGLVLAVVAAGGVLGSLGRYQAGLFWPSRSHTFDWTILAVNVIGCLCIGVVMTVIVDLRRSHPLVRPFWVTGVLGGFTTFSTYSADLQALFTAGRFGPALGYLGGTAAGAVGAVWLGRALTHRMAHRRASGAPP